jgi:L-lactate permease
MPAVVDGPALGQGRARGVLVAGAGVAMPAGHLPGGYRGRRTQAAVRAGRSQGVVDEARGALMEALAGFGTPVAISSVMLIALGFRPLKAATIALVANTAPDAFGALAVPIITLETVTKLPVGDLGAMIGRQTPILAVFVPLALVLIADGSAAFARYADKIQLDMRMR